MGRPLLAAFYLVGVPSGLAAAQSQPHARIRITSRLGVEKECDADSSKLDDALADAAVAGNGAKLPLLLQKGLYAGVPVWELQNAALSGGALKVTLKNGASLEGRGTGSVRCKEGESFGAAGISALAVVEVTKDYVGYVTSYADRARAKSTAERWRLSVGAGLAVSFVVRNPTFAFRYYSSSGYIMGGSNREETDGKSFWLKVGGEEIEAPLTSFSAIAIPLPTGGRPTIASVTAPNGTTTSGELVLKYKDSAGWHSASSWGLLATLDGSDSTSLFATEIPMRLEKVK